MGLKLNARNIIFLIVRTMFLTSRFFVLVLFLFSISKLLCSCSVPVGEQEQVREHVIEQLMCSFIPGSKIGSGRQKLSTLTLDFSHWKPKSSDLIGTNESTCLAGLIDINVGHQLETNFDFRILSENDLKSI